MPWRYFERVKSQLDLSFAQNEEVLGRLQASLGERVMKGESLYVFGSGHSALFPLELFHRAGGVNFVVPVVDSSWMPQSGPALVRAIERTPGIARVALDRVRPKKGEMLWLVSQSGINGAVVDLALYAKELGLTTVAWTSVPHSRGVSSRHPSGKRLFEVCDETVDLCGEVGDASIELREELRAGPLSTVTAVTLAHALLVEVASKLEASGRSCVYTSVNTPTGEARNRSLEEIFRERWPWLS